MAAGKQLSVRGRFWLRHLERWKQSGLSQAQYCREHKLSAAALGWWKGQLSCRRKRRQPGASTRQRTGREGTFVELALPDSGRAEAPDSMVYEIAFPHGCCLRLGRGFESERVRQLLALLEARC